MTNNDEEWPDDEELSGPVLGAPVTLGISPTKDLGEAGGETRVVLSIQVPDSIDDCRASSDICCVVDISGSMGELATYEQDGVTKHDGLTILDITKHAVKTVIRTLKDVDRFALVAFDDSVDRVLSLTSMTEEGKAQAIAAVEGLVPRGRTNIWGGVLEGMEALQEGCKDKGRQGSLLLLTDGLPNISPPRGHIVELRDYKEKHPEFAFQMSTFGFGYSLDSELLLDLAVEGNGTYAFIPDAVIIGTVFVNAVANSLCALTQDAIMHVKAINGAKFAGPVADFNVVEAAWGNVVSLGPLQLGQPRELVVPMCIPEGSAPYIEATLSYVNFKGQKDQVTLEGAQRTATQSAISAAARSETVTKGYQAVKDASNGRGKSAQQSVQELVQQFETYEVASSRKGTGGVAEARLVSLKNDVEGRMSKAFKGKERFNRWGKHYLRALMRAHQIQQCTNFMDPGLQTYAGRLFCALRTIGEEVFFSLPPPKPSKALAPVPLPARTAPPPQAANTYIPPPSTTTRQRTPSPDMRTYFGGSGGG